MNIDDLVTENSYPEVADQQIEEFWDRKEVEWIDKETIILHGINEGKKFKVVFNKRKEPTTRLTKTIIPLSYEWHKLTNFRNVEQVYKHYRYQWDEWKKQSSIPYQVIMRVEGY